ncbi:GFA family protein [Luteimonas kalidii]|uniref:GFA family protein n=1 Tax=Luteimonas kalidii TaxID=3042025 RepID=A0ABT6JPM7_9GAMM|nr:GFA family protein [Luteimonas kalidii]MDH5832559.1 GFA family protein [Luteimonas kalidii]
MTIHQGSCHCGRIAFELEGEVGDVFDCNCSMCRRRGGLLAAFPRAALRLTTPGADLSTYRFNREAIDHHFCDRCGIAPFSEGKSKDGAAVAMVNVRCLPDVDLAALNVVHVDGASF